MTLLDARPRAVSFDFYQTLAFHRDGRGRGVTVMAYLEDHGLEADPWEHQILYELFAKHLTDFDPGMSEEAMAAYRIRIATHLFERLHVGSSSAEHAAALWRLLGPASLALYPEATEVLSEIRNRGFQTVITSNWQAGLVHFCAELGILEYFDHVFVSAEIGSQKPDPGIFDHACKSLGVEPAEVLHVGDSVVDDFDGATNAGLPVILLDRNGDYCESDIPTIATLRDLLPILQGR